LLQIKEKNQKNTVINFSKNMKFKIKYTKKLNATKGNMKSGKAGVEWRLEILLNVVFLFYFSQETNQFMQMNSKKKVENKK
jgi:hypothetical protein